MEVIPIKEENRIFKCSGEMTTTGRNCVTHKTCSKYAAYRIDGKLYCWLHAGKVALNHLENANA